MRYNFLFTNKTKCLKLNLNPMKRSIFNIIFILTLFTSGCETSIQDSISSSQYYKQYGTFYDDHMYSVYPLNGGCLISGSFEDESDSSWAYVIKTSSDGMKEWDTAFNDNTNAKAYDALYTSNRGILVAVGKEVNEDTCYLSVVAFEMDGIISNTTDTVISASGINDLKIRELENGTIRLFSHIYRYSENNADFNSYILVHDFYPDSGLFETVSYEIEEQSVGGIAVETNGNTSYLGYTFKENNSDSTNIRLMSILGNFVSWNNSYGAKNSSETCSDIIIEEQGILLTGNYKYGNSHQIFILNSDFDGSQFVSSTIQKDDFTGQLDIGSFTINKDNNFVFAGSISTGVDRSDIVFLETTRSGENINFKTFGTEAKKPGKNTGLKIKYIEQSDSYILAGELEPVNNTNICIFSLNSKGSWID